MAHAVRSPCEPGHPRSLHVVGRSPDRENADLCGEYVFAGGHAGRPAYQKPGANTAIRYAPRCRRWVIDRQGLRDSDICAAYADDSQESPHPGCVELVWHIWDSRAQAHVADTEVAALDSPGTLSLIGRAVGRENHAAVGQYELIGIHHGRPTYRQPSGEAVLRFFAPEGRWLLSAAGATGNVCSAYADGAAAPHPACAELVWNFWEAHRSAFVPDPEVKTMSCPVLLHVIGRASDAENARICGTYHLAGAHGSRPLYVQPGTQNVIRYSAKTGRWLIDCDGLAEPSIFSRLYQWILSGDGSAASERCSAYADAGGAPHPGFCSLEWLVWETRLGRHNLDAAVRATTAPLAMQVVGREPTRENGDIVGEYLLAGTCCGRPAYAKSGSRMAIRFWAPMSRWVIDREGLRHSDHCVAYADDPGEAEHPASERGAWHVFESSRGLHLADPGVAVAVPADAPVSIQPAAAEQLAAGKRSHNGLAVGEAKRMRCADPFAGRGAQLRFATLGG